MGDGDTQLHRRGVVASLAASTGLWLAGCLGGGDDAGTDDGNGDSATGNGATGSTPSGDDAGAEMAEHLTVWGWDVAARSLDLTDDPYQEQNGGTITVEEFDRPRMKAQFQSAIGSESGTPGCAMMESVDGPAWVETGGLRDLSDWVERDGVRDGFLEGKWEALSKGDGVYALPWDIGPVGTFYRRDVFQEYDVDPDSIETWEEFVAEGEKLPAGQYLLNIPSNDYDGFWRMQFRQLGGQPFTADGAVNIHSEESLVVARNIQRIRDAGVANDLESWSVDWFDALASGKNGSLMAGAWIEGTLKNAVGETEGMWGVMKPPALESGGSRATNWGGSNLVVPAQIDDATARRAWDYMRFTLASEQMQARMYRQYGIFPAYEPAYGSDVFDEPNPFFDGQQVGRLFTEIAPDIQGYRYTVDTPAVTEAINTHFSQMVRGDKTAQRAVRDAAQQVAERTGRDLA